jgi:hypothetical protein
MFSSCYIYLVKIARVLGATLPHLSALTLDPAVTYSPPSLPLTAAPRLLLLA